MQQKVQRIAAPVVAANGRRLEYLEPQRSEFEFEQLVCPAAYIVMEDRVLMNIADITGLHYPVAIFDFPPIEHIILVREADPAHRVQPIQAARPDSDVTLVVSRLRRRADLLNTVVGNDAP